MIFFKKAIRSMLDNKKAYIACIILIGVGIFVYVSLGISSFSLERSKDIYYKEQFFPDAFARVGAIANTEVELLTKVEGVEKASGRLTYDSRVLFEDKDEIVTLRVSTAKDREAEINNYYLIKGQDLKDTNDIMISEDFLNAHNLKIGDNIGLNIEGKEYKLNICAAVQSPEYIYAIKDQTTVLPDAANFSFAFVKDELLGSALGKQGLYNDLCFILENNVVFDDIKIELEDALERYGLISLYDKEDHISYAMLDAEIESNKSLVTAIPSVFIMMSMAILYMMLKRVIEQDRTQIGTLKAFGYSNFKIMTHYLFYGIVTGFLGGVLGIIVGYFASASYIVLYSMNYKIPILERIVTPFYIITGLVVSVVAGMIGAFMGARAVLKLTPADSMRSKAPKLIRNDILLMFPFLKYLLTSRGAMAIRSIQRSKFRSFFIVIGIMFSFSIMAFMGSYNSMIDQMLLDQFQKIQVYDVKVTYKVPVEYDKALSDILNIDHINYAEALFEVPVVLKNRHINSGVNIIGINQNSVLYKIYDNELNSTLRPPKNGIILSSTMADSLKVKRGDVLYVSSQFSSDDQEILVWDVVNQNLGSGCYMEAGAMADFFETEKRATSVIFRSDDIGFVRNKIIDGKNIAAIENSSKTLESYLGMLNSYQVLIYIMDVMAVAVAFAIIYNTTVISLSEREREFATLRVLGLQLYEVSEIMSFEYWILTTAGIILGFPFNNFLKQQLSNAIDVEMFSIPIYTPPVAYLYALIGCVAAVFISNYAAAKNIAHFDMVEVLKERE